MKRSGAADLPLHYGYVPSWLAERMAKMGLVITESIITEYGTAELLRRLSEPFWFQCLGAVMGMDWHSSGITTSVMGALKKAINPNSSTLGIYICGGKGKHSKDTPLELLRVGERTGLDGNELAGYSKLSAKVDNSAVQDGFQLYTHNFVVDRTGKWTVIQQGMDPASKLARRYHWHSGDLQSFTEEPHSAVCGRTKGMILNLTASEASVLKDKMLEITKEHPLHLLKELQHLVLPAHHDVRAEDINLKRLGSMLWLTHEQPPGSFEELLSLKGVGPRTLQSLSLVSEVIHGTPSRFRDPARFAFAHGGKDGHPFPVPLKVYDETIAVFQTAVHKAKLGDKERSDALKSLHQLAAKAEKDFIPNQRFDELVEKERAESWKYGGQTVFGKAKPVKGVQLRLF
jgi:hypothetical protein